MIRMLLAVGLGIALTPISLFPQDFLAWDEDVRLTWDDFRGRRNPDSPPYHGAESHLSIRMGLTCANNVPELRIAAEFDRTRSWARPDMPASLLEHEQIHFDIAEIYARRTREEAGRIANLCQNAPAVREIVKRNHALASGLQEIYDEETHHGTRREAQAEWSRRIRSLLGTTSAN